MTQRRFSNTQRRNVPNVAMNPDVVAGLTHAIETNQTLTALLYVEAIVKDIYEKFEALEQANTAVKPKPRAASQKAATEETE